MVHSVTKQTQEKCVTCCDPYLRQTFDEIRALIDLLPDESLARQREWQALLPMIEEKLLPYNDAFAIELSRQLPLSGAAAAEETTLMLKSVVPQTAGLVPPELIMADSTKFLLQTKVGNQRCLACLPQELKASHHSPRLFVAALIAL